ncbi:transmembrane 6 superfamily member 1-like isoform X2 [Gigantopelta aegis]|uniref:transmembrane 6 superfamily member 1-like isoform X2 n=1 Tax=Gigantopelta aegis TaxID=1735272 RepID=UPI001B888AAB|nr:transmembrane 6 superfamily member 1-like isoform X2 [Gigantopelta aegis]
MGLLSGAWCPVLVVTASSFTSLPVAYFLNKLDAMKDDRLVFVTGIVCMILALLIPALCIRRFFRNVDPLIYAIIPFAWAAVWSLLIGLELDGFIAGVISFYVEHGEPYFKTAYGTSILFWDGFIHFPLYLAVIALYCHRRSYREVGLFWVGSIMNSMVVFMPGNVIGTFDVKWSYLLNIPYMLIPLWAGFKFFRERPMYIKSYYIVKPLWTRRFDCLFVVYFIGAGALAVFRGLAVLDCKSALMSDYISNIEPYLKDPNGYPKMQMLCYMYYYLFYYLCAIYGMMHLKQGWLADWALLHAGASLQGQFVHILGSMHSRTAPSLRSPTTGLNGLAFWTINLILLVVPQLFAWRCVRDPENCGRTYTIELAEPRNSTENSENYRTKRD